MKLPCAVVRDLLPLYAEKLTEDETTVMVNEHLEGCAECRRRLGEIDTKIDPPAESAGPLKALKKEIKRRRLYAALIAALFVFAAVYTWFYHASEWKAVPWEEGLIKTAGIQERPVGEIFDGQETPPDGSKGSTAEALVIQVDSRINGIHESVFDDEDGTRTLLLQGWSTNSRGSFTRDYSEMILYPVPDRLIYDGGEQQQLVWGEPLSGGVEVLPRLALGFYGLMAAALAVITGVLWFILRKSGKSPIVRQVFFAPLSYLAAHFLIKGFRTQSDFLGRDFVGILILTAVLYALMSLVWQAFLRRRKEK